MDQADAHLGQRFSKRGRGFLRGLVAQLFGFIDERTDPVRLAAFEHRLVNALRRSRRGASRGSTTVFTGVRPGGSSSMTDTSRSA